jgi:parallel beta-helix repeat protein
LSLFVLSPVFVANPAGLLSVDPADTRYLVEATGKSVLLSGAYLNHDLVDSGNKASWKFATYVDFLKQQNHNFTRLWSWEQVIWSGENPAMAPDDLLPYERSGGELARDGGPKYDLNRFNRDYFDQLRSRVRAAQQRGVYVSVVLFEGYKREDGKTGNPWLNHPFHRDNNVNRINGRSPDELQLLSIRSVTQVQKAYIRKVVDTLNDLDNVLYEISGESALGALAWQYDMINYLKDYQATKKNRHPVGMSYTDALDEQGATLLDSPADWIMLQGYGNSFPRRLQQNRILVWNQDPRQLQGIAARQWAAQNLTVEFNLLHPEDTQATSQVAADSSESAAVIVASPSPRTISSFNSMPRTLSVTAVETPAISPNGGNYSNSVSVGLQTTTTGASIYYTTDGTSPTESSKKYSGPFALATTTLVKAKAFKSGAIASSEVSAWFTKDDSTVNPASSSLVAHWKFDEGSGSTASDASGNGNAATLVNGPVWTAGKVGKALSFDGIDDNLTVAPSKFLDLSSSFTLSAWVNPSSTFADFRSIVAQNYTYYLYASSAGFCGDGGPLGGFYRGADVTVCQTSLLPIETWTHLTVTYNGSRLTLYRNGVAVGTSNVSGPVPPTTGTLQIAASQYGEYFKGLIDEVRVYNTALSATDIQAAYKQEAETESSGLVAHWKFDDGSGSTASDASGNGNTATLINGPLWAAGKVGKGLYFDGVNDNLTVAPSNSLNLSSSFTLAAWVNPSSTFTDFRSVVAQNYTYYLYASAAGFCGDGSPLGGFYRGRDITVCQSSPLPTATWTHLTVTYNGSTLALYRNGVAAAISNVSGALPSTTGTLQIGASQYGEYFKGLIDEVRIYSRTLSAPEIQAIYQQDGGTPQPVATPVVPPNGGNSSGPSLVMPQAPNPGTPMNFTLSNGGNKSVNVGSSITNSINASLVSGSNASVSFSVSGLPSGATASFSSAGCNPTCSTLLNISTTPSTGEGSYPITITATGGGVSSTTAFTLAILLAASAPSPAATVGKVYYVATNGSDSSPGTVQQPFRTIKKGISVLSAGATLYIRAGSYDEVINSGQQTLPTGTSWNNAVTIGAYPGERATIRGIVLYHSYVKYLIFDGLIIDPNFSLDEAVYLSNGANHVRVQNSEMKNARAQGVLIARGSGGTDFNEFKNVNVHSNGRTARYDHGIYIEGSNNLVEGSQIHHNAAYGVHVFMSGGSTTSNNVIRDNIIHNNGVLGGTSFGIILSCGQGNMAYNNLVYNNTAGIQVDHRAVNAEIYNNTVYGNNAGGFAGIEIGSGSSGTVVKNNILYQNPHTVSDRGSGTLLFNNFTTNPGFANPAAGNFSLLPGSPAIGVGAALSGQ